MRASSIKRFPNNAHPARFCGMVIYSMLQGDPTFEDILPVLNYGLSKVTPKGSMQENLPPNPKLGDDQGSIGWDVMNGTTGTFPMTTIAGRPRIFIQAL